MKAWPELYWDPAMRAHLILLEIVAQSNWKDIADNVQPHDDSQTQAEINDLIDKVKLRPERREEILEQANVSMVPTFTRSLMISPVSHPYTMQLIQIAIVVGRTMVMYAKQRFLRPRPSQLAPSIRPMFEVPGHPSYPSGHSMQAHLIALLLAEAGAGSYNCGLQPIAGRIAENREIAGVHYPSDSLTGQRFAEALVGEFGTSSLFSNVLERAKREWAASAECSSAT